MKKIFWGLVGIPVAILLCYVISYIAKFAFFLVEIDNIEFGFPVWLDISIDIITGVITYLFMLSLFNLSKKDAGTVEQVISIIVGFVLSFITHCILKYWYIVLAVIIIFIAVIFILYFKRKQKKEQKNESV